MDPITIAVVAVGALVAWAAAKKASDESSEPCQSSDGDSDTVDYGVDW